MPRTAQRPLDRLSDGDGVEVEIEGIGVLRNTVVAEGSQGI